MVLFQSKTGCGQWQLVSNYVLNELHDHLPRKTHGQHVYVLASAVSTVRASLSRPRGGCLEWQGGSLYRSTGQNARLGDRGKTLRLGVGGGLLFSLDVQFMFKLLQVLIQSSDVFVDLK